MKGLRELLLAEKTRLEVIKQRLDSELAGMPAGNLRICKSNNRTQYYHHKSDSIQDHGTYISRTIGAKSIRQESVRPCQQAPATVDPYY